MENEYNNIILGGKEVVITGWGEYEIKKRSIRAELNDEKYKNYYSKKYIYPQDIIISVLSKNRHKTVYDTIHKFINTLKKKESENVNLDNIWVMPALTSTRLSNFLQNDLYDMDEIHKINLFLRDYADMMNFSVPLDSLLVFSIIKEDPVHISNNEEIMNLEKKMIPNINTIERNLGILASNCDRIRKEIIQRKEKFGYNSESDYESDSDNKLYTHDIELNHKSDDLESNTSYNICNSIVTK